MIWFCSAFHQAGNFSELTSNFLNHFHRSVADSGHGDRCNSQWQGSTDEDAHEHHRIVQLQRKVGLLCDHGFNKCCDDRQRRQRSCTNCEAFANGGSGVTNFVETICDVTDVFTKTAHFSNPPCVISNGAISV